MSFPPALLLAAAGPEATRLPLEMFLVFGCAKLAGELFERMRQPGIAGEILAGILIGPAVFGWVAPGQFLDALAQLGVMFLLFRVGLEVKASELMEVGGTALIVAVLGVILPFGLGWGILRWWGEPHIEAIFVGAAMVATSVGITAQVLASKGLMQSRAAKIILGAAVIDDILGLLVLALVSSMAAGAVKWLDLGTTAVLAVGFTVLVATVGTRAASRVVPKMRKRLRTGEGEFALSMILLFGLSLLAVYAGVAAIIGAFLAGMALSESVGERVHDLAHGVTELLVPFFLAGIGLHMDLGTIGTASTLILAIVIFVAAVISKFVGCGLGALKLGRTDAARIGVGMVPRGEVGLVVAQVGLSLGVIAHHIYGVVVFMAVATTLIAPPLLALAFRGAETPAPEEEQPFKIG
ncbi:MAG TPA: cation:proton antiporter [Bryobacteraceae bacterium]|nr:cation:proton antiporter [Bryobacteraceae bacterium]